MWFLQNTGNSRFADPAHRASQCRLQISFHPYKSKVMDGYRLVLGVTERCNGAPILDGKTPIVSRHLHLSRRYPPWDVYVTSSTPLSNAFILISSALGKRSSSAGIIDSRSNGKTPEPTSAPTRITLPIMGLPNFCASSVASTTHVLADRAFMSSMTLPTEG